MKKFPLSHEEYIPLFTHPSYYSLAISNGRLPYNVNSHGSNNTDKKNGV